MQGKNGIKRSIVFFLVPDFSMIAFATAIEPLRLANRMLGFESTSGGLPLSTENQLPLPMAFPARFQLRWRMSAA